MTKTRRRIPAAVCAGMLVAGIALSFAPSRVDAQQTLFAFQIDAAARGFVWTEQWSGYGEAKVPESSSTLSTGPVGFGLSAMFWPGPAGGNIGTTIVGINPDAPQEFKRLDSPVRAEARTGQDPPTTTNDSYPGATMSATAKPEVVEATAHVDRGEGGGSTFGSTATLARSALEGSGGLAEARSEINDVSMAGGAVTIDSVVSFASAKTDGLKGEATGDTLVSGLMIGGQPATFDDEGVRIGPAGGAPNDVVNQLAQQAIGQAGLTFTVVKPVTTSEGAAASYTAGSLIIGWKTPDGGGLSMAFGGATASINGSQGSEDLLSDLTEVAPTTGDGSSVVDAPLGGGGPGDVASGPAPGAVSGVRTPSAGRFPSEPVALVSDAVSAPLALAALGLSGLMALGMRRLSDNVLAAGSEGSACPLDGAGGSASG